MEAAAALLPITFTGAAVVVGLAQLARHFPFGGRLHTGGRLAASHTLIMSAWLTLSPLYVAAERAMESPYGDVFVPYLLVPGSTSTIRRVCGSGR